MFLAFSKMMLLKIINILKMSWLPISTKILHGSSSIIPPPTTTTSVGSIRSDAIGVSMHRLTVDAWCPVLWNNQCPNRQSYLIVREIPNSITITQSTDTTENNFQCVQFSCIKHNHYSNISETGQWFDLNNLIMSTCIFNYHHRHLHWN